MWNFKKSVTLTLVVLYVFSVMIVALLFVAPSIFSWFIEATNLSRNYNVLVTAFYCCAAPAIAAVAFLFKLLYNIRGGKVFVVQNTNLLRYISWCCFVITPIVFFAGFYYNSLFVVSVAAAFVGLILRVVKNVMAAATELKNENELTI
ncbi:MAG: DUF2975 domain-containing protein [Clostridia bacterium]|nr:DUF2975 domain-containing protein [Clostridia bacterium]